MLRGRDGGGRSGPFGVLSTADPIEVALARALTVAADAGDLTTIRAVVAEIEARRLARAGVASIGDARARRGRS